MGRARMEALGRHNKYVGEMFSEGNYPDGWLLLRVFLLLFVFSHHRKFLVYPQTSWVC